QLRPLLVERPQRRVALHEPVRYRYDALDQVRRLEVVLREDHPQVPSVQNGELGRLLHLLDLVDGALERILVAEQSPDLPVTRGHRWSVRTEKIKAFDETENPGATSLHAHA